MIYIYISKSVRKRPRKNVAVSNWFVQMRKNDRCYSVSFFLSFVFMSSKTSFRKLICLCSLHFRMLWLEKKKIYCLLIMTTKLPLRKILLLLLYWWSLNKWNSSIIWMDSVICKRCAICDTFFFRSDMLPLGFSYRRTACVITKCQGRLGHATKGVSWACPLWTSGVLGLWAEHIKLTTNNRQSIGNTERFCWLNWHID